MVPHDEYLALRERAGIVDRSDRGRLRLRGGDRRSYLQGLLTNDVEALTAGTGCYAALLTPQGRMISDMRVLETGDEVLIDLPGAVAPQVRDHFANFIFAEDVTVDDESGRLRQCGIYGPAAASALAATLAGVTGGDPSAPSIADLEALPPFGNLRLPYDGISLLAARSDDLGVPGFELFVDASHGAALVQSLIDHGAVQVGSEAAEVCRVEAGRPLFGADMDSDTIPLEAGITDRAISLTKGCYVGQEIIIRVLHRGHGRVARRLVGMRFAGTSVPTRDAPVAVGEREIGRVTSAVYSPAVAAPIALGYVHRDFAEPGTRIRVLGHAGEQAGTVVQTPFV